MDFTCSCRLHGWEETDSASVSMISSLESASVLGEGEGHPREGEIPERMMFIGAVSVLEFTSNGEVGESCSSSGSDIWVGGWMGCKGGVGFSVTLCISAFVGDEVPNLMTDGGCVASFFSAIFSPEFSTLMDLNSCVPDWREVSVKEVYRPEWM